MENVLRIDFVSFLAFNKSIKTFDTITTYLPDIKALITPQGQYLKGRVTLSNITQSSKMAVMIFNKLLCIDDILYRCNVRFVDSGGVPRDVTSNNISISVQVPPSKPDSVSIVFTPADPSIISAKLMEYSSSPSSSTVTSKENEISSVFQTAKQTGITKYSNITVVCTGDVGKPPAEHFFQKYRSGHSLSMIYKASETSVSEMSENCSYYRTSNLTFQVTAKDNNAVIRCVVNSSMEEPDMFVETAPIEVYYEVSMPTIITYPNKLYYVVGEDTCILLTCKSDGNPKPNYQWYKENHNEVINTTESWTITDLNVTNSEVYTCNVSNTFNGGTYTKSGKVRVNIINK
ncbi:uncharacterized protein LOC127710399, partial [Mytilus californianus]|uniref:uncharacterized protein LOC127710399 n=1 Tax=Mytilus californianus TaxID=6549 RepID=UPI0022455BE9